MKKKINVKRKSKFGLCIFQCVLTVSMNNSEYSFRPSPKKRKKKCSECTRDYCVSYDFVNYQHAIVERAFQGVCFGLLSHLQPSHSVAIEKTV